jgi:rubrerythrin
MKNVFSAAEIVELGVRIEKNGRDFYSGIAKSSVNPRAMEVFAYLSEEEEKHIERFEKILAGVKKYEPAEAYTDDYFAYLKALSDEYVFTKEKKGLEMSGSVKTDLRAVEMGIGFEKDSILFYHEMKNLVPEDETGVINKLINEEKEHLKKLERLRKKLFT